MDGTGRARWAPLTGLAAAVLWFIGVFVAESGNTLGERAQAEEILAYFQAETGAILIGAVIFLFGVLMFMFFVTSLRAHTRGAATQDAAALAFGSGLATAVLLGATWVPQLSVAIALEDMAPQLSAETAEAGWHLGTGFFVLAEFTCAPFLFALAYLAQRGVGIPKWLAYFGVLLGIVMLIPPIGWAALIFGFPVWLAIAGIVLSMRAPASSPAAPPTPS